MSAIRRFASVGFGSSVCRREKASNRWVSAAARLTAPLAAFMNRSISSARPCAMRICITSRLPLMAASRLLKSWASPPVSWPTASIFCACRSASCARSSASACSRSSVMSRPLQYTMPPSGTPTHEIQR